MYIYICITSIPGRNHFHAKYTYAYLEKGPPTIPEHIAGISFTSGLPEHM